MDKKNFDDEEISCGKFHDDWFEYLKNNNLINLLKKNNETHVYNRHV